MYKNRAYRAAWRTKPTQLTEPTQLRRYRYGRWRAGLQQQKDAIMEMEVNLDRDANGKANHTNDMRKSGFLIWPKFAHNGAFGGPFYEQNVWGNNVWWNNV